MKTSHYYTKPGMPAPWHPATIQLVVNKQQDRSGNTAAANEKQSKQMTKMFITEVELNCFIAWMLERGHRVLSRNANYLFSVKRGDVYRQIVELEEGYGFGCGLKKVFVQWRGTDHAQAAIDRAPI